VKDVLVHNPAWIVSAHFAGVEAVAVAPGEDLGGNVLLAGETLLTPADSPRTAEALAARGFRTVSLDISEMRKADAALTCMSLISDRA
jgi:dimethylargininase